MSGLDSGWAGLGWAGLSVGRTCIHGDGKLIGADLTAFHALEGALCASLRQHLSGKAHVTSGQERCSASQSQQPTTYLGEGEGR